MCNRKARLAQSVESKALNIEVMGSSPIVGVQYFLSLSLICFFCCRDFFVYAADLSVQIYFSSRFFSFATDLFITFCLIVLSNLSGLW